MGNQQAKYIVYVSCDCKDRLYIGYTGRKNKEAYLGSFTDKTFEPKHKLIIDSADNKLIACLKEWCFLKAWSCHTNPRFANKAIQSLDANAKFGGFAHTEAAYKSASAKMTKYNLERKDYSPEAMAYLQKPEIVAKRVESAKNSEKYRKARQGEHNGMHGKKHKPTSLLLQKIRAKEQALKSGRCNEAKCQALREEIPKLYIELQRLEQSSYNQAVGNTEAG